jgi:Peptidase A4 family
MKSIDLAAPARVRIPRLMVIAVPLLLLSPGAADSAVAATPAPCNALVSPYTRTAPEQAACGMKSFPQTGATTVTTGPAAGATEYKYRTNGLTSSYIVPPTSFNAATATPAELSAYGIPAEPAAQYTEGRAMWLKMVNNLHFVVPPQALVSVPVSVPGTSANTDFDNWSGIINTSATFTQSEALFDEPSVTSSSCTSNSAVYWAGLGGVNSGRLAQNGTAQNTPGLAQDEGWYEILPSESSVIATPFYATQGEPLVVSTNEESTTEFAFYYYNYYTGQAISIDQTVPASGYDGTTSDFIVERPTVGGSLPGLTDFTTVPWYETYSNNNPSVDYSHIAATMNNPVTGNDLAIPHSYGGTYGQFSDDWYNCQ